MNIDRRISPRYPLQQLNCVGILKSHRDTSYIKMLNISQEGILVQSCKKMLPGEICILCLYTMNYENKGMSIYVHAQVCHTELKENNYLIGLEFTYIHSPSENFISYFLDDIC
ncbi:PilZ domain-containing protein [Endozoicomonas sp. SM1973]|uniref:PilZ domain-containing protein n=1 Tax=Spartinivicinus marinus TaxID=2994442 RepID=A0A853IEG2_9GAMM|nr:PilZ domain-containing protein [Spartinivicinus marinus]MCX4029236.1 PilZ domain-containing protein [Spartinivicinus marinus]NYZ65856.1 PilZ domain-containing protein [Spartinivicinus marinus]